MLSNNKIVCSETIFRFLCLPKLDKNNLNLAVIFLTESRQVIWEGRNFKKHESKDITDYSLVCKFLSRIKYRMKIDLERFDCAQFGNIWCEHFGTIDIDKREIKYDNILDIKTYFKLQL